MEQWYVAQTQFAQEKRAELHLKNQGVDCFLPLYTAQVMKNGAVKPVAAQALFPGYLFVHFDPEVIHTTTIKGTRGISSLVSFGGLPAPVPDDVVTRLRSHDCLSPEPDGPVNGDRIEILDGAYEGLEAVWLESDGMKRAMLLLTIMNREVRVPVCGRRGPEGLRFRVLGREVRV